MVELAAGVIDLAFPDRKASNPVRYGSTDLDNVIINCSLLKLSGADAPLTASVNFERTVAKGGNWLNKMGFDDIASTVGRESRVCG
jgi:hypothetical protein